MQRKWCSLILSRQKSSSHLSRPCGPLFKTGWYPIATSNSHYGDIQSHPLSVPANSVASACAPHPPLRAPFQPPPQTQFQSSVRSPVPPPLLPIPQLRPFWISWLCQFPLLVLWHCRLRYPPLSSWRCPSPTSSFPPRRAEALAMLTLPEPSQPASMPWPTGKLLYVSTSFDSHIPTSGSGDGKNGRACPGYPILPTSHCEALVVTLPQPSLRMMTAYHADVRLHPRGLPQGWLTFVDWCAIKLRVLPQLKELLVSERARHSSFWQLIIGLDLCRSITSLAHASHP
jgi:hypothetical protein